MDSPEDILLTLVQGSEGRDWAAKRNGWSREVDVCTWEGIGCDNNNNVVSIELENTNLIGTLPSALTLLSSTLNTLLLSQNKLYGSIPVEYGTDFSELVVLDLSYNELRGPVVRLSNNPRLVVVDVAHNQLSSTLPSFSNTLIKLETFDVRNNHVNGGIPESFENVVSLNRLNLSNNYLTGPIPSSLGNLLKLKELFLSNNRLSGTIPPSITRETLPLRQIALHGNFLSGTLPPSLGSLQELTTLFIDNNKFTGTIPEEVCTMNLNEVIFSSGKNYQSIISGDIEPNPQRNRRLQNRRNGCNSVACPSGYHSTRAQAMGGVFPCAECGPDETNPFLGSNQCFSLVEDDILKEFYYATDGERWDDQHSWADRAIPTCDKKGVTCDDDGSIIEIHLVGLGMSGTIPESMGFLRTLEVLDLSDNRLYGNIPMELKFTPLRVLDLSGNMMMNVPPSLCHTIGINNNGQGGTFSCDYVICPKGSYNKLGYRDKDTPCYKCSTNNYMGSKTCSVGMTHSDYLNHGAVVGLSFLGLFTVIGLFSLYYMTRHSSSKYYDSVVRGQGLDDDYEITEYDEINFHSNPYLKKNITPQDDPYHPDKFSVDGEDDIIDDANDKDNNPIWLDVPESTISRRDSLSTAPSNPSSREMSSIASGSRQMGGSAGASGGANGSQRRGGGSQDWLDVPHID